MLLCLGVIAGVFLGQGTLSLLYSLLSITTQLWSCCLALTSIARFARAMFLTHFVVYMPDLAHISAPAVEKTACATMKNRRDQGIAFTNTLFNDNDYSTFSRHSSNYYTNSFQYFLDYFMIPIMPE